MSIVKNAKLRKLPMHWLDLLAFKVSWVALVYFQQAAIVPVLGIIAFKIVTWPDISRFLLPIMVTIILGTCMDLSLSLAGIFMFPDSIMPLWLVVLWVCFALTLPRGFSFLANVHPLVQSGVGVIAGSVGYLAGEWLGAVSFGFSLSVTLGIIAMLWAVFLPGLFRFEKLLLSSG